MSLNASGKGRHMPPASHTTTTTPATPPTKGSTGTRSSSTRAPDAPPASPRADAPVIERKHTGGGTMRPEPQASPQGVPVRTRAGAVGPVPVVAGGTVTRKGRTPAAPGLREFARALAVEERKQGELRARSECEEQLVRLGTRLRRPPDRLVVEALADRVITTITLGQREDLGDLAGSLVTVLDGPRIDPAALRTLVARLLAAAPALPRDSLHTALFSISLALGGANMHDTHRQVLLQCLVDPLDAAGDEDGVDQALADTVLSAMTHPGLGKAGQPAHREALVARAVGAGTSGSVAARGALLVAMARALAPWFGEEARGEAYLALVRAAPTLDPAMVARIAEGMDLRALVREPGAAGRGPARITAWTAALVGWAAQACPDQVGDLMRGAADGLWADTDFAPELLCAAMAGVLQASHALPVAKLTLTEWATRGLLASSIGERRLQPSHVQALLAQVQALPWSRLDDVRAYGVVHALATGLAQAGWPVPITEVLVDHLLAGEPGWSPDRWIQAGQVLGECLADLDTGTALFVEVIDRIARTQPLDRAARLMGGFVAGMRPAASDPEALLPFNQALSRLGNGAPVRCILLGASIATALRATDLPGDEAGGWQARLQALPGGKVSQAGGKVSQAGGTAFHPISLGRALMEAPAAALAASRLPPELQRALFESFVTDMVLPGTESLRELVKQLAEADFHGDEVLRVDLVLTLFQHAGRLADRKSFVRARDLVAAAILRTPATPARPAGDRKAAGALGTQEMLRTQMDALFRYYVTASAAPSFLLDPPREELARRLAWLESPYKKEAGLTLRGPDLEVVKQIRADYAVLLAEAGLGGPAPGDGKSS